MTVNVVGVALRKDSGLVLYLPAPNRHCDIFRLASKLLPKSKWPIRGEQGFLDSDGRFLDRRTAMEVARISGQVDPSREHNDDLFSEDLW